ncbi:hypothetical protein IFR05_005224 [Cadophora sp. M221]|nr:hypothetical protein IFR05_005224 [Cadophora sp. M221]
MSFPPHPCPHPHPHPQGATALTPIPETPSTFVARPPAPRGSSPLKQLHAPPVPFVPQSAPIMSSPSAASNDITLDFYILDPQSPARFSTHYGARAKRELVEPFPATITRTNMENDVEVRATQLMKQFLDAKNILFVPKNWYILHEFFDGHDLWIEGAEFCYWVILAICRKNTERNQIATLHLKEIDKFAYDWLMAHRDVVMHNPAVSDMIALFTEAEQRHELEGMTGYEIQLLNERLSFHRHHWMVTVAAESGQQFAESHQQPLPQYSQQMHLMDSQGPINQLDRTQMATPNIPQVHRIRQDSMPSRPANDQQPMRRGSVHVQPDKAPSLQPQNFIDLILSGRQVQSHSNVLDPRRQVTPNGHQIQGHSQGSYNENGATRPRGLSNATQNSRGRDFSQNSFQGNARRHASDSRGGNSSGNTPSRGPIYVRHISPPYGPLPVNNRVVSAPTPGNLFYPANRIISGGRPRITSPTNREQNFHNSQAIGTSPTDRRGMRTPRRYASGSFALQDTRMLPSSPTDRVAWSNDVRVDIALEKTFPYSEEHSNSTRTIHYYEAARDCDNLRTLHIEGFDESMLLNHQLKGMMEECGKVVSIHYLPLSNHRAFVTFIDSVSVGRAIMRFNQKVLPSGHRLRAGLPHNKSRSRSNSNASQNYRNVQHNPIREFESRSRRPSIRNPSNNYHMNAHSRRPSVNHNLTSPPGFLEDQLQAAIAEVMQHQSALERQMPLSSIENIHSAGKKMRASPGANMQGMAQARSSAKKENLSPRKNAGHDGHGENSSPKKNGGSGKNHSKHRKGSKQNTSTRPTPAVTPIKSMSTIDLKDAADLHITTDLSKLSTGKGGRLPLDGVKKNSFKQKNVHDSSKSDASFNTDAPSDTTLSPLEPAPLTRDTSFSVGSSRKHSQVTSSKITKSQSAADIPSLVSGAATNKSKAKKLSKHRGKKQSGGAADEQVNIAVETAGVASKEDCAQEKKDREVIASHSKKGSNVSVVSNNSLKKVDAVSVQPSTIQPSTVQGPPIDSTPKVKSDGTVQATSCTVTAALNAVVTKTQSPRGQENSWPSLAKSPTIGLDSGRLPPPVMGPLNGVTAGNKKSVKPAVHVVAVPRAYETQPRPPRGCALGLDIGTETWPFVRKFRGR